MRTWKNKICAIILLATGYVGIALENDGTALVLFATFAIPLFFAKENCID